MESALLSHLGETRSVYARDHALIAPDGHVPSPLPAWEGAPGVVLISPAMGARFSQTLVTLEPSDAAVVFEPLPGTEVFIYVMEGEIAPEGEGSRNLKDVLQRGDYCYLPAYSGNVRFSVRSSTKLLTFEKHFEPNGHNKMPAAVCGHSGDVEGLPFLDDPDARLQTLLPTTPEYDMAVNIFTYQPGTSLPFVETHIMEHGLLMLHGGGIYRLNQSWYPVSEGDCIWMASYCPQWFAAVGKTPARYIYYKDVNRDAISIPGR